MPHETGALGGAGRRPRKRRILRWIGYLLAGLAGLVVLLAIIGAIYQSRDRMICGRIFHRAALSRYTVTRCISIAWAMEARCDIGVGPQRQLALLVQSAACHRE